MKLTFTYNFNLVKIMKKLCPPATFIILSFTVIKPFTKPSKSWIIWISQVKTITIINNLNVNISNCTFRFLHRKYNLDLPISFFQIAFNRVYKGFKNWLQTIIALCDMRQATRDFAPFKLLNLLIRIKIKINSFLFEK